MTPATRTGFAAAVAMKRLSHPGIVRVLDVATDGGNVWVAMDVASGGSLADRLAASGPLPLDDAIDVAVRVCDALAYAHAHGVLHLDVKPANVLFGNGSRVLLADFGDDTRGTAGFAAPEVERGDATVDERADVFGAGALLAAMLGPGPSPIANVVTRAMAAEAADRYPSVRDLAAALRTQDDAVPAMPEDSATRPFGPRPPRPAAPAAKRRRHRWLRWAGAAVAVVAALVGATVIGASGERREHGACATPATPENTDVTNSERDAAVASADVDGDGCTELLVIAGNVIEWNGIRFAVGEPGDVVLVGDWDCDGVATAAAWRKADGVAFVFDGWAGPGEGDGGVLPAARRISLRPGGGPPTPCRG